MPIKSNQANPAGIPGSLPSHVRGLQSKGAALHIHINTFIFIYLCLTGGTALTRAMIKPLPHTFCLFYPDPPC